MTDYQKKPKLTESYVDNSDDRHYYLGMNKYTSACISATENNPRLYGGLLIAAIECYPKAYEHLKALDKGRVGFPNPRPLLKYVIRQRALASGGRGDIVSWGRPDELEPVETDVFCGQFSYDKDLGGFVPMYVVRKRSKKLADILKEREPCKIRCAWSALKPFLCSPDGYEPSLVDSFDDQHLYFLMNESTFEIKIGISIHPEIRRCQIQREVGAKVVIMKILPSEGRAKERELHTLFGEYRTHGEWFVPHQDIADYIDSC